jgi:Cu/Ag efflux protein CusF
MTMGRYVRQRTGEVRARLASWRASWVVILCMFASCAAVYNPPPLATGHPAYPDSMAAPLLPRSTTLAYGPLDIPASPPGSVTAQRENPQGMAHGKHGAHTSKSTNPRSAVGEGQVITVMPEKSQIVVAHGEIPGVMGAMTMGYTVTPASLLTQLKAGDTIRFTLDTKEQAIIAIEKLGD